MVDTTPETVVRVSSDQFDKAYDILSTNYSTELYFGDIGIHSSSKDEIKTLLDSVNITGYQISE
jgi:hypothetical protein